MERARKIPCGRTLPNKVKKQHKRVGVNGTRIITPINLATQDSYSNIYRKINPRKRSWSDEDITHYKGGVVVRMLGIATSVRMYQ